MLKAPGYLKIAKSVKGLGAGLSFISMGISLKEAYENPTLGNGLKVVWNVGVMFTGPAGGVADALFEASGYKDKMFEGIDDMYQSTQKQPERERVQDKP